MSLSFARLLVIPVVTLAAALSAQVSEASVSFTCESTQAPDYKVTTVLDDQGVVERMTVDLQGEKNDVYTPTEAANYDTIAHFANEADLMKFDLLQQLKGLSNPSAQPHYYLVHSITDKGNGSKLEEVMDYLSDDMSGVLILEARDQAHNVLGRSMIIGWGGFFASCR